MVLSPEMVSQLIMGLLIAIGTLGVRWSATGKKNTKKLRAYESKLELAISFIYAQRDRSRLHNDKYHPPTAEDPDGMNRIKIVEVPKELRVSEHEEDE